MLGIAVAAGTLYPRDPLRIVGPPELWPLENSRFLLGTDALGRDIAAIIAHGGARHADHRVMFLPGGLPGRHHGGGGSPASTAGGWTRR